MPRLARLDTPGVLNHIIIRGIEPDEIYSKSRQKTRAEARRLYCYWSVVELGYSLADLVRLLGMTGQGVVRRIGPAKGGYWEVVKDE